MMKNQQVMVIHLNKKMKISLAFAGGIVTGFWKFFNDNSTILMASKTAAIIEGCGTALLFGACGVLGKKVGDLAWTYIKLLIKTLFKKNETNGIGRNDARTDGNIE